MKTYHVQFRPFRSGFTRADQEDAPPIRGPTPVTPALQQSEAAFIESILPEGDRGDLCDRDSTSAYLSMWRD